MNIDPRGGQAQDLGTSIDAFGDEDAARQLLENATAILQSRVANAPPDFVTQVFAGAAPEDLLRYEASEIAAIAAGTPTTSSTRAAGASLIALPQRLPNGK